MDTSSLNINSSEASSSSNTKPPVLRSTKETHPNLPPGLILGPDGKPCKVCNSFSDWAKLKVKKKDNVSSSSNGTSGIGVATGMGGFAAMMSGSTPSSSSPPPTTMIDRKNCPPDTEELGRSTWTFLHTAAAYYPSKAPSPTQENMRQLLTSLSQLYPCIPCANDFQDDISQNPPDLTGREGLSKWLCERHNSVNEKLGKKKFDCDWKSLSSRWRDGPSDGRCD